MPAARSITGRARRARGSGGAPSSAGSRKPGGRQMVSRVSGRSLLAKLDIEHPEWRPLLALIDAALREAERPDWARFVPTPGHPGRDGRPLLDGAVITVAPGLVGRWVRHLLALAAGGGMDVERLAKAVAAGW